MVQYVAGVREWVGMIVSLIISCVVCILQENAITFQAMFHIAVGPHAEGKKCIFSCCLFQQNMISLKQKHVLLVVCLDALLQKE